MSKTEKAAEASVAAEVKTETRPDVLAVGALYQNALLAHVDAVQQSSKTVDLSKVRDWLANTVITGGYLSAMNFADKGPRKADGTAALKADVAPVARVLDVKMGRVNGAPVRLAVFSTVSNASRVHAAAELLSVAVDETCKTADKAGKMRRDKEAAGVLSATLGLRSESIISGARFEHVTGPASLSDAIRSLPEFPVVFDASADDKRQGGAVVPVDVTCTLASGGTVTARLLWPTSRPDDKTGALKDSAVAFARILLDPATKFSFNMPKHGKDGTIGVGDMYRAAVLPKAEPKAQQATGTNG
jgi:hypothetical protein